MRRPQLSPMRVFDHRHAPSCKPACEKHGLDVSGRCLSCNLCSCQQQVYSAIRQGQSLFLDIYTFCYGLSKNTVNDMLMELINKGVVQTRTKCLKDKAGGRIEVTYQLTRTTQ